MSRQIAGLTDVAGDSLQDVGSQVDTARGAASGIISDLASQALDSVNAVLEGLPPPARDALTEIARQISQASDPLCTDVLLGKSILFKTDKIASTQVILSLPQWFCSFACSLLAGLSAK